MRSVLSSTPFNLVDFLFYLERFEVVEFWLMRLEFGMEFVLASFFLPKFSSVSGLGIQASSACSWAYEPFHFSQKAPRDLLCHQSLNNFLCDRIPPLILYRLILKC